MNAIRQTQALNKRELENATPPSASWHVDYRDTAYIYVGGLHLDLTEGDVVIIFSQYGNPTHLNLVRDKETGKSKGFGFLKYEDQRSCDLAVDNLGGAEVLGRMLRVDHTRYKLRDDEDEDTYRIERWEALIEEEDGVNANGKRGSDTEDDARDNEHKRKRRRPMIKEEKELEEMLAVKHEGEEEDPMRQYMIQEKKQEVERAKEREGTKEHRHHHHHQHQHRHRHRHNGSVGRSDHKNETSHGQPDRYRHRHRTEDEQRRKDRVSSAEVDDLKRRRSRPDDKESRLDSERERSRHRDSDRHHR
jgi:RNA-binding motif X-linked protein 2